MPPSNRWASKKMIDLNLGSVRQPIFDIASSDTLPLSAAVARAAEAMERASVTKGLNAAICARTIPRLDAAAISAQVSPSLQSAAAAFRRLSLPHVPATIAGHPNVVAKLLATNSTPLVNPKSFAASTALFASWKPVSDVYGGANPFAQLFPTPAFPSPAMEKLLAAHSASLHGLGYSLAPKPGRPAALGDLSRIASLATNVASAYAAVPVGNQVVVEAEMAEVSAPVAAMVRDLGEAVPGLRSTSEAQLAELRRLRRTAEKTDARESRSERAARRRDNALVWGTIYMAVLMTVQLVGPAVVLHDLEQLWRLLIQTRCTIR